MNRRAWLSATGGLLAALLSGCVSGTDVGASGSPSGGGRCSVAGYEDLVALLSPSPEGFERAVDERASAAYLDEYGATDTVSAEYTDGDGAVLDDLSVRVFRFEKGTAAERTLRGILNDIEFDSGRVGVGVLDGRVGVVAAAPRRDRARSLLKGSSAITARCLERHEVLPSKTVTPGGERTRTTATSE